MKLSATYPEFPFKRVLILTLTLVLLTIIPLYYNSLPTSSLPSLPWRTSPGSPRIGGKCDVFQGEWVPNPSAPYYTNSSCRAIRDQLNCMKYGRPDTEFMKWRWKPQDCELPVFNPAQFLELARGKSLAFVGDSMGRNQMLSLMCLLNTVTHALDVSPTADENSKWWSYPSHNFTVANIWSPFLVKSDIADPIGPTRTGLFNLYLDKPDVNWTAQIAKFDYIVISTGHWFTRPTVYHYGGRLVGCNYCLYPSVPNLTKFYGYKLAFKTTFQAIADSKGFNGIAFLRTFAPSHFENGEWNNGGDCARKRPLRSNETELEGMSLELYRAQVEEFSAAEREASRKGLKFRLLDITRAMLMRPDGHPSRFGHAENASLIMYNDCVHWCLPGPIDAWNDFLFHMLKV